MSALSGLFIYPPATRRRTTRASLPVRVIRLAIIQKNLFSGLNVAQREEEQMAVDDFGVTVRLARMVDVLGPIATATAVNRPV